MQGFDEDDMLLEDLNEDEKPVKSRKDENQCITPHTMKYWIIGSAVSVVVIICVLGMVKTRTVHNIPNQNNPIVTGQQVAYTPPNCIAGQNFTQGIPQGNAAAYVPPNCANCPSVSQCFPQGNAAAYVPPNCATCPSVSQCFPQGNAAAYVPPNCATCPSVSQCFPQGNAVALVNPVSAPVIYRDAVMSREFRGVCPNSHTIR